MLTVKGLEAFKEIAPVLINLIPGGAVFGTTDLESITWKMASSEFDIPAFQVGGKVRSDGAPARAIKEKRVKTENIPRRVYGTRVIMTAIPVFDGDKAIQALEFVLPRLHPVARAFDDFAPIIANMFSDGAVLFWTGLKEIAGKQASKKFDMPDLYPGKSVEELVVSNETIKTKKMVAKELDASIYGVPVQIVSYPLFDEDNATVIGTLGIGIPRSMEVKLRHISSNLARGMEEVSAGIEELAASAGEITINEQELNHNVQEVNKSADEITEILTFIKQIADETKMLGLNAAIEAARAGDAGRGFGVVAEEIRKLSDESKKTVVDITELIRDIKTSSTETARNSDMTLRSSQEQAAATQEITASIEEITGLSEELDKIAREL